MSIKTYRYNALMNNVSHVLTGKGGNTVRFDFTHGNVLIKKQPELTLQNKYCQDLLEQSQLFKGGRVRLVQTIKDENNQDEKKAETKTEKVISSVDDVTSEDELIAYINKTYEKKFITVASALKFATSQDLSFPNLKVG